MALTAFARSRQEYFAAKRAGKPQSAAKALAAAILSGTMDEVDGLTRQIRQDAGVQDLSMLDADDRWTVETGPHGWGNVVAGPHVRTEELRTMLADGTDVKISWPSLYGHWGVRIMWEMYGVRYSATNRGYAETETSKSF